MDKKSMLEAMISHYTNGNKAKFAGLLGVSPQTISAWGSRNTFDHELIYTKCRDVSADWLLTGEGSMLQKNHQLQLESIQSAEQSQIVQMFLSQLEKKDEEIKNLNQQITELSSQIAKLEEQNNTKGLGAAKNASSKKPSSPNADNAASANAQ